MGIATVARRGSTAPPSFAALPAVTRSSQLDTAGTAGDASDDSPGEAAQSATRRTAVAPGFLDLTTLAPRDPQGCAHGAIASNGAWPDVTIEVTRAEDGAPVPAAEVVVSRWFKPGWRDDVEHEHFTAWTDADGLLTIHADGHFDVAVHAHGLGWKAACVELQDAKRRASRRIALEPCVVLAVRLVDDRGLPVADARVKSFGIVRTVDHTYHPCCASSAIKNLTVLGQSDPDGRVPPVECVRGRKVAFLVEHEGGSWMLPALALDVAAGSTRFVELRLPALARVAGVVRRADGSPSHEVKLSFERCFDAWCNLVEECGPHDDGRFAASIGPPGRYLVTMWSPSEKFGWIERERRELTLPAGETLLEFVDADPPSPTHAWPEESETARATICGRVVSDGPLDADDPRLYGRVQLVRGGSIVDDARLDDDGCYSFDHVVPGTYALIVLVDGCTRRNGALFEVAGAGEVVQPEISVAPLPPVRGRVVAPDGRPVEGVGIASYATTAPTSLPSLAPHYCIDDTTTDDAGAFEVAIVSGPCRLWVDGAGIVPFLVPLPEDGVHGPVEVVVPAVRALRGRIVVAGGLPDVKQTITILADLPREFLDEFGDGPDERIVIGMTEVDADGGFTFTRVPCTAIELEFCVNTSGGNTPGCIVARRHVPVGAADVELGTWRLANDAR
jgi:hypothetical protein